MGSSWTPTSEGRGSHNLHQQPHMQKIVPGDSVAVCRRTMHTRGLSRSFLLQPADEKQSQQNSGDAREMEPRDLLAKPSYGESRRKKRTEVEKSRSLRRTIGRYAEQVEQVTEHGRRKCDVANRDQG